jgi:hypothetical protein
VLGNGKPVAGATVDVEWIEDLNKDQRHPLATYRTATDGQIRLRSGPAQLVEVAISFGLTGSFRAGRRRTERTKNTCVPKTRLIGREHTVRVLVFGTERFPL